MAKTEGASPERVAAFRTGLSAESRAAAFLIAKGYRILAKRFRTPYGEIDLVARRRNLIAFVEVKARSRTRFGTPAEFVTPAKMRQLTLAAEAYLIEENLLSTPARFDVVEVYLSNGAINHIENAFDAR